MLKHDLSGRQFGMLTVVRKTDKRDSRGERAWLCKCECGGEKEVRSWMLRAGKAKSCGCIGKSGVTTHGMSRNACSDGHDLYGTWALMHQRCKDKKSTGYQYYGGRGIRVCPRWDSFETFLSDMGPRPTGHSIDRIDVDGNYEPENCRWAPAGDQANNKRSNRVISFDGESLTLAQWAKRAGLNYSTFWGRISRGETLPHALRPSTGQTGDA